MSIIRVDDHATRPTIELAIARLRAKQERMPAHWVERREEIAVELEELVNQWLAASS